MTGQSSSTGATTTAGQCDCSVRNWSSAATAVRAAATDGLAAGPQAVASAVVARLG